MPGKWNGLINFDMLNLRNGVPKKPQENKKFDQQPKQPLFGGKNYNFSSL